MKTPAKLLLLAAVLIAAVALPWWGSDVMLQFAIDALLLAVLAQSWNILGGYTGYASFGQSTFYGLGAYGVAVSMTQLGWSFATGLLVGGAFCALFALLLGVPVLRLRGHYFAIATLALAQVMNAIISNIEFAGANIGLVLPLLKDDLLFYEAALALLVAATLTVWWISRSRFGYGLIAIRENEEAAAVMGINTTLYKVMAFMIAGVFAGLAGGIHAYHITFLDPAGAFDLTLNVKMIIMAVFGGPGTVLGPVVGAFLLSAISELLAANVTSIAALFFGIVIVVAVVAMPRGLADLRRRIGSLGLGYFADNIHRNKL
ncbi:MAG: branched-chain amino acid ABC transporter permease [Zoogloeaceae bacterium]|jgi:branched-chain amino acid transport system permease protein|nr:branched-chain amino acid ABC transporter permease [Zoogloeaceae bacterium]